MFEVTKFGRRFACCGAISAMMMVMSGPLMGEGANANGNEISLPAEVTDAKPFSMNDVSILFPVPNVADDLNNLISLDNLQNTDTDGNTQKIWTKEQFEQFISISESAGLVAGTSTRIRFPAAAKSISNWFVAGIRIDPGAPGVSGEIADQFGQDPQIRLIAQPVTTRGDGRVQVHDITAHLIYSFSDRSAPAALTCLPKLSPDFDTFGKVLIDTVALRDKLESGEFGGAAVSTTDVPLSVHPGLEGGSAPEFKEAIQQLLETHISNSRLSAMATMALPHPAPEPWIFLAMTNIGPQFVPVPNPVLDGTQFAQMLSFVHPNRVVPTPTNNNKNPIICRHAAVPSAPLPKAERSGVSTADIFDFGASGASAVSIIDRIANSSQSHFFNADCVSCHTESSRATVMRIGEVPANLDPNMMPKENWNVRNFGWFPSFFRGTVEATITRRTASETEEVVEFLGEHMSGN